MAQTAIPLARGGAYQQVAPAGAVTIQLGEGEQAQLFVGPAAPANDSASFTLDNGDTFNGTTPSPVWMRMSSWSKAGVAKVLV